jgi:cytochrome c oxidase subunit I+III
MLGDMTAFVSLVFGYFFYWTSRPDFVNNIDGPGVRWPVTSLAAALGAWALTMVARRFNRRDTAAGFYGSLIAAGALASLSAWALVYGPIVTRMNPSSHVYPATVWVLVLWTTGHLAAGVVMHLYCLARRAAGRLSSRYDIDMAVVTLYWHFVAITCAITVGVIAGFPLTL